MPLVASGADGADVAFEQVRFAGLVRLMAARAAPAVRLERMDRDGFRHLLLDRFVAREADRPLVVSLDQAALVGRVRVMARRAALLERLVRVRLLRGRLHRGVAAVTELGRRLGL